ncbi:MAG: hypothetical protein L0H24_02970, partial [Microlunatus sp.]|nr:hypothetical protein [Microlunatus sp.]
NRAVCDGAAEYVVSWPTAHKALIAAAARWLPARRSRRRCWLGIDETRFRTVSWILDAHHRETVGSVADLIRRLLGRRAGIAAGVSS